MQKLSTSPVDGALAGTIARMVFDFAATNSNNPVELMISLELAASVAQAQGKIPDTARAKARERLSPAVNELVSSGALIKAEGA